MRFQHKTPIMKELAQKLSDAKYFSNLDIKNGYWSITLDSKLQLLITFNSPFGRYCFQRMSFVLVTLTYFDPDK